MSKADKVGEFVNWKISLLQREDPWSKSMLAKLRRCAGKDLAEASDAWEVILNELPDELLCSGPAERTSATEAEWAIHTALTLYALHQHGNSFVVSAEKNDGGLSFGSAIRQLISPDKSNEASIKKRFDAVVTSGDLCELSYHARGIVQLMCASAVPIKMDYRKFAKDLYFYQYADGRHNVRLGWGTDFYNETKKKSKEKKDKEKKEEE